MSCDKKVMTSSGNDSTAFLCLSILLIQRAKEYRKPCSVLTFGGTNLSFWVVENTFLINKNEWHARLRNSSYSSYSRQAHVISR